MVDGPYFRGNAPLVQSGRSNAPQIWGNLSARLKAFAGAEEDRLDRLMHKKAKEQGRIDAQGRTAITLRNGDTIADDAWNQGAAASHLAAVNLDIKENLARFEAETPYDSKAYKEKSNAHIAGLIENTDQRLQPIIQERAAESILDGKLRIDSNTRTEVRKDQKSVLEASFDTAFNESIQKAASGDYQAMLDSMTDAELSIQSLLDGNFIEADKAAELRAKLSEDTDSAVVFGEFDQARRDGKGDEYLHKFINNPPKELEVDSVQKLAALMDRSIARDARIERRMDAENTAITAADNAERAANLKIAYSRGEIGEPEIEKAAQEGIITQGTKANWIIGLDKETKKAEDQSRRLAVVSSAITGGAPLSPSNPGHVKGVNELWNNYYSDKIDLSTDEGKDIASEYVSSTGIMPEQMKDLVHANSTSGSVDQAVSSSDLLARINEKSPQSLDAVSSQAKSFAMSVSSMVAAGTDPEQAVEISRQNAYQVTKEQMQAIKDSFDFNSTEFRSSTRDFLNNKIDDDFDRFDISQPDLPIAMEAEFNHLLGKYIGMTRDADQARKLAYSDLKSVWGMSEVNGKAEMMKYSPELVYGGGRGGDWMRDQLLKEVKDMGYEGDPVISIDPNTARQKYPSYLVMVKDATGEIQPVLDSNNEPSRWVPDYSTSKAGRKSKKELDEIMENAREKRKKNLQDTIKSSGDDSLFELGTSGLIGENY